MNPYLSIIVPIHNEEKTLRSSVEKLIRYGETNVRGRYEIILVENGSTDKTLIIANELQRTYRPVRSMCVLGRSKAQAVCAGMLAASGEYRYMADCDLSVPIDELSTFLRMMRDGWDLVIASREHPDSKVTTSFKRWFIGRVFQSIVENVTGLDYKDTQCGFKLFHHRAAEDIFSRVTSTSMAFDVEVLYLALQLGYFTTEMPVTWENAPESRVRLIADSWLMLRDVLQVKKRHERLETAFRSKKVPA